MAETGIIKATPFDISKLLPEHRGVIQAKFEKKISEYTEEELLTNFFAIVNELIVQTSYNVLPLTRDVLVSSCLAETRVFALRFTLSDCRIALNEGYRGTFGDIIGLSAVNFSKCFKAYDKWEMRLEANASYNKIVNAPKTTDEPLKLSFKVGENECLKLFNDFRSAKPEDYELVLFTAFLHYEFLKQKGKFSFTNEEKKVMLSQARTKYWASQADKGISALVIKALKQTTDNKNVSIVNEAKRIAVKRYFTDLITNNKKLEFDGK